MLDPAEVVTADFRLWLIDQMDRCDSTGGLSRTVFECPDCDVADADLPAHIDRHHGQGLGEALLKAVVEWERAQTPSTSAWPRGHGPGSAT